VLLIIVFAVGYLAIVFEAPLRFNKSAAALLMGVACWTVLILDHDVKTSNDELAAHFAGISQIVFFLLGAMTIVELIDAHDGFELITSRIKTRSRRKLLVVISVLSFFLSAVLDNLTTSIVMMSLIRKLANSNDDRMTFGGVVIIAANAGGAWSPIGDVTTTMLWVGGQVTTTGLVEHLIVPSVVSVAVPVLWIGARMRGEVERAAPGQGEEARVASGNRLALATNSSAVGRSLVQLDLRVRTGATVVSIERDGEHRSPTPTEPLHAGDTLVLDGDADAIARASRYLTGGSVPPVTTELERRLVLGVGVGVLLFVPVFKTITGLPPAMGILLGLGVLWVFTELIHKRTGEPREQLSAAAALQRVDSQSVLFFLGILLAIGALESDGLLRALAHRLDAAIGNVDAITVTIGLSSSVIDNVPLVAASQGMYSMATFPQDHHFWLFLTYCAGTGGSILIIGSAAGVAVMGIQRITFGWYVKRFTLPALAGYFAGALAYLALSQAR
jgi:Na+/H+ antiporter NhaD/arsenite permease-like protein